MWDGRKTDPGRNFDWRFLKEVGGHGVYPRQGTEPAERKVVLEPYHRGEAVSNLQTRLREFGYNVTATGEFNLNTAWTIRAFNMHYN